MIKACLGPTEFLQRDKKKIIDLFTLFDKISIHGDFFSKENVKDDSNISTIGKRLDAHL